MNILFITNHLNIGGITSYVYTLATGLIKNGHTVYLASGGGELLERFSAAGVGYLPIPIKTKKELNPRILFCKWILEKKIKQNNIDIIHSHSRTTQVLGALLARSTGVAYVSTCHGFFKNRFLRRLFPCWGSRVIAISQQVKQHLIDDFKVDEKNIVVVHNGINVNKFKILPLNDDKGGRDPALNQMNSGNNPKSKEIAKIDLGLRQEPVIGIVARLSDVKGHKYLIMAMPYVLQEFPQAQLLIAGEGKERDSLKKQVVQLGISGNVIFAPQAEGTQSVLSAMDVFVMPSLHEGLGLALMEAMASGLAVVGSDIGGIKTLIKDGVTGLLVPAADPKALAGAIVKILKDKPAAERLGQAAQIFIAANFSQEKMVKETEGVYEECLTLKR